MASAPTTAIDPRKPGQYTLKIGKGVKSASSASTSTSYTRVKYNHKPNLANGTRTTKLSRSKDGEATLFIKDEEDGTTSRYAYKGQRNTSKSSYVLIFDPNKQTCTLEPVKSSYNFNLTSTPWETSKEKLAKQYEQIDAKESAGHGAMDEDPDGEPDADNPYDFRHFLTLNSRASQSASPVLRPQSKASTPSMSSSSRPAMKPMPKAHVKQTQKVDPLRQAPRRQKPAQAESKARPTPTPTVRLDRRASTRPGEATAAAAEKRLPKPATKPAVKTAAVKSAEFVHSSDEDSEPLPTSTTKTIDAEEDGGLEIDWGNEKPKPKPWKPQHHQQPSLSHTLDLPASDGPISLHSAANSPHIAIPRIQQTHKKKPLYEEDVIDLGTSDAFISGDEDEEGDTQMADLDVEGEVEDESGGDDDVEPMELGSPAQVQGRLLQQGVGGNEEGPPEDEVDYDDDDLEAQMMAAMEEEGEDGEGEQQEIGGGEDESDVSEAE